MFFKLTHILTKLAVDFAKQESLTFRYGGDDNASVIVRPLTSEEKTKYKPGFLMCTAQIEIEPSDEVRTIFERLLINKMFRGFKKKKTPFPHLSYGYEFIDDDLQIEDGRVIPVRLFPVAFQKFESHIEDKLTQCIDRSARIIRWRTGLFSPHNPIHITLGVSWSFDNQTWKGMPSQVTGRIEFELYHKIGHAIHDQIVELVKTDMTEPIGHDLFQEAH